MNWTELTIGKKIAAGFGIVLVLMLILGGISFLGVGGIVENAGEVIQGNKLDSNLAQKEVDHLNWVNRINALLTDEHVTSLQVQTDDHQCGFGKWLYGEGRKEAERLVPELAPLLKEIEAPHKALHNSAIEIGKAFKQPHAGLALTLSQRLTDHVNWVSQVGKAIASEAGGIYAYQAKLKNLVDQTVATIEILDRNNAPASVSDRKRKAYDLIKDLGAGDKKAHCVFIVDTDTRMVLDPLEPGREGTDQSRTKDVTGKHFFLEMVKTARHRGEGFVSYQWPLPATGKETPRLAYFKLYKPFGWVVGIGEFLDHTNPDLVRRAKDLAEGKPFSIGVEIDPSKCAFGRFLDDPKTRELLDRFPELKATVDQIHAPHKRLHETAAAIESEMNQFRMKQAMRIFAQDTQQALAEIETLFNKAIGTENTLQAGLSAANQIYAEKTIPSLEKMQTLLEQLRKTARKNIMTDSVMLDAASGTKRNVTMVSGLALIAGIFLALVIARGVISALSRISGGLGEGANQVASAAGQVSASSQAMAEGASEQAAAIEETSSSMEEMSSMTRQNAKNADHANDLMKEANQIVSRANDAMARLTVSMTDITRASEETSKIVKTIDEIAFQTNLLALNAAVEAARAGDAGAGFAVVADEVRNLAMRSAAAAKDTAELIQDTVKKVADGSELVKTTNAAFDKVAQSSGKVGELVAEISEASREQSEGITQVNSAVSEMDSVVQRNAATAEESASASEEMSAQAEQLREYVGDLVMMVTGQRDSGGRQATGPHTPSAKNKALPAAPTSLPRKKAGPEQEIPFDTDQAFKDF